MNIAIQHRVVLAVTLVGLALSAATVNAEVYQWRDENGKLHFSDKKPKQHKAEDISESVEAVNIDESGEQREKLGRLFKAETAEERARKEREKEQKRQQLAQNKVRCDREKKLLSDLRGRVYFVRKDGSSYDVTKEEQARRVATQEKKVRKICR